VTAHATLFACKPRGHTAIAVEIGDKFVGRFQVALDPADLADGFYDLAVKSLRLDVGMTRWDHSTVDDARAPSCNQPEWHVADCLRGYYGSTGGFSEGVGFGVESGQITFLLTGFFTGVTCLTSSLVATL
jgi:hypothetical protein